MEAWPRHLHRHDVRLLVFVLLNALCITGFLYSGIRSAAEQPGGWRRIDTAAVKARIEAGDLMGKEASWYHIAQPGHDNEQ